MNKLPFVFVKDDDNFHFYGFENSDVCHKYMRFRDKSIMYADDLIEEMTRYFYEQNMRIVVSVVGIGGFTYHVFFIANL